MVKVVTLSTEGGSFVFGSEVLTLFQNKGSSTLFMKNLFNFQMKFCENDVLTLFIKRDSTLIISKTVNVATLLNPRRIYNIFQLHVIPNRGICLFSFQYKDKILKIYYIVFCSLTPQKSK